MALYTFIEGNKIKIQPAPYIEDGWYIEIIGTNITVYEIPLFGGDPIEIGDYLTLMDAIKVAESLN